MKRIVACIIALSILGCAKPILRKPAIFSVKKLAVVSIYTNHDIYNVKEGESKASLLDGLKKAIHGEAGLEDAHVQVATSALITYSKELGKLSNWDVVDSSVLIADETYMAFVSETMAGGALARFATANYVTPPGMALVPFEAIAGKANTKTFGDDPTAEVKARLAQLCNDLGVDGVAVIDVDVAYETGAFSGMSGTGLLSGIRGKATPSVSSAMMVITRDGNIAVQTKHVTRGGGKRHSAGKAPMLLKGKVDLTGEKGAASIKVIDSAFLLNADALKIAIQTEMAEG
ncbi:MAG: hypothetical protein JRG91_01685 [Deltaproteobacteria bacterium]|nr:hypothetical protein [Deltaproteobacteria bacterium]